MYKIGEFSILSKTTIKALRYYEKEKLLIPHYIDAETGYRYYETNQLIDVAKIISLKQTGLSINEIKEVFNGKNYIDILKSRKKEIENQLDKYNNQLTKINYLLEGKNMDYEVIFKELPDYTIYYKEGRLKKIEDIVDFILGSAEECKALNPDIKCITPDYCYVNYLDKEFKEENLLIRYAQAVEEAGISNENIKFEKLKPVNAACIYCKGPYTNLPNAYSFILKFLEENNYEIIDCPRERYINGMWNKETEEEWLTEIQFPIRKK